MSVTLRCDAAVMVDTMIFAGCRIGPVADRLAGKAGEQAARQGDG
jgi:hypothetical protein